MKKNSHLTEEEIQDYIASPTDDDKISVIEHLQYCKKCSEDVETYKTIWSFFENDYYIGDLNIDLAKVVSNKLFHEKDRLSVFEIVLNSLFMLMAFIALVICFYFLITSIYQFGVLVLSIIPLILYFSLAAKEVRVYHRKLYELMSITN